MDYSGLVVDQAKELSYSLHGGQVVLTQYAWVAVQDRIPAQAQVTTQRKYTKSIFVAL